MTAPGLGLDLGRGVPDDLALEGPPDALAVHEAPDAADPDGLLEEPHAPPLHVAEQYVEPGQARLDVAQHLVVRQRELAVDALDGLDVLGQELQPLERDVLVPGREPEPHVERVEELEPDPLLLVRASARGTCRPSSNPLARHASAEPSARAASASRAETGKRRGASARSAWACSRTKPRTCCRSSGRGRMSILFTTNTIFLPHSRICSRKPRSLSVNGRSAEVTKSTRSARGMKSRVSSSCRRMIALVPGRVHDRDLAEQLGGIGALQQERLEVLLGDLGAVAEEVDPVGGGRDPFGKHALAEQRVDEARLAGVELAGHDEQEESRELVARLAEAAEIVGLDVAAEARERRREALEQLLLAAPEVLLPLRQDRAAAQQSADHDRRLRRPRCLGLLPVVNASSPILNP